MAFNINEIRSNLALGGARPSLFQIIMNNPVDAAGDAKLPFMAQAAQIPASTVGTIEVPYVGRKIKIAGDRTFEPWTVTVINDTDFAVRNAMERWMNGINQHNNNTGLVDPVEYQADMIVEQLNKAGESVKRYDFRGTFPTNVSAIELSYDTENAIEEFTVELQVQYWESDTTS